MAIAAGYDRRATGRRVKQLNETRKAAVERLKRAIYSEITLMHWRINRSFIPRWPCNRIIQRSESEAFAPGRARSGAAAPDEWGNRRLERSCTVFRPDCLRGNPLEIEYNGRDAKRIALLAARGCFAMPKRHNRRQMPSWPGGVPCFRSSQSIKSAARSCSRQIPSLASAG